ncbi:hypothetical protein SBRCBS47491_008508 [Sporothrix bragantina]|uniref:Glycerate dehydrogenase n=1 Tax=Sporothrix bragantina TaxID=671064 RepID=A0ABP0CMM3_9PEZI
MTDTMTDTMLPQHLNIVALQTKLTDLPGITLPAPYTFTLTKYVTTPVDQVGERLHDADIAIITTVPIRADTLDPAVTPKLKLICAVASGTDTIDLAACRARGIRVLNNPACNIDAVAEHALALYFSARRSVVPSMMALVNNEWPKRGTLIKTAEHANGTLPARRCAAETAVVVGYGGVGKRVVELLRMLGMNVVVAGRKGQSTADLPAGRVAFAEAIKTATALFLCCPRNAETLNLLSTAEFASMLPDSLLINVSRGGIVDEVALLVALQTNQIAGAGVDVFAQEPASSETSPLLAAEVVSAGLNLVMTPHTAWVSAQTTANNARILLENLHSFIDGKMEEERIRA